MSAKRWLLVTAESPTYYTTYAHGPMCILRTIGGVDKLSNRYKRINVYAVFVPSVRYTEFKESSGLRNVHAVKSFRQIPEVIENFVSHDERMRWNSMLYE